MLNGENLSAYILENFQLALDEGWIEAFYQPVVRTLTRNLCGMEALARWRDPEKGLLSPSVFIPVLEQNRLIHKLDCRILELVCRQYHQAMKKKEAFVPVSFNLSRADFDLRDMPAFIDKTVIAAGLPRDMINIEITESAISVDPAFMKEQIDRIRTMGYQVWMDDFGSQYSSLNNLKEFDFDELKIDMKFLSDTGLKSREIISAVVDMAKHIRMQTLAEGVETGEQADFLYHIGCEKMQGYYFGKPLPYEECMEMLRENDIVPEAVSMRKYYDALGSVNVLNGAMLSGENAPSDGMERSGIPFCILEMRGEDASFLVTNQSFRKELKSVGIENVAEAKERILANSLLARQIRSIMGKARDSGRIETLDLNYQEHFCTVRMRRVGAWKDGCALLASFRNLSNNPLVLKQQKLNDAIQVFYTMYDRVDLIDVERDTIQTIYNKNHIIPTITGNSFRETAKAYVEDCVYQDDRERYRAFCDVSTVRQRFDASVRGYLSERYRVRAVDGRTLWVVQVILQMPSAGDNMVLSLVRSVLVSGDGEDASLPKQGAASSGADPGELWQNLLMNADIGLFWKDKDRRFLGANQTFLDYYGIRDVHELIGKNDEDMGWHVDPEAYKSDELRVLGKGEITSAVPGKCICRGRERDILATKMPLYQKGEITGLIGYFVDVTNQTTKAEHGEISTYIDSLTELLNMRGLLEESIRYTEGYLLRKKDYALLYLDIRHFRKFNQEYGREWSNHLLIRVAEEIRSALGVTGIAVRTGGDQFAILRQFDKEEEIRELEEKLERSILNIGTVDDMPCTPYVSCAYVIYSDGSGLEQMYSQAKEKVRAQKTTSEET